MTDGTGLIRRVRSDFPLTTNGNGNPCMLELIDVHVSYGPLPVLRGASCTFNPGRAVGLIGDNGAGKTTLLRTATTMLAPQRGEVRLSGKVLTHNDVPGRRRIGALIEQPGHYDELTASENLTFFYSFHVRAGKPLKDAVADAIETFGLSSVADQRAGRLSTGYRQRLAVARAFHPNARIVLLDEPLSGLDPTTRSQLKQTIHGLVSRGTALVISSHGLSDLDTLCDDLYVLSSGVLHRFNGFSDIRARVGADRDTDLDTVYTTLISHLQERSR